MNKLCLDGTIIFDTFEDAMDIHKKIFELVRNVGVVSYADLYSMVNRNTDKNFSKEFYKYGWTNLFGVKVEYYKDNKWIIKMPELINIEKKENE